MFKRMLLVLPVVGMMYPLGASANLYISTHAGVSQLHADRTSMRLSSSADNVIEFDDQKGVPEAGLEVGYHFNAHSSLFEKIDVGVTYNHFSKGTLSGDVLEYGLPDRHYYDAKLGISSDSILLGSKLYFKSYHNIAPFISVGFGLARNNTNNYQDKPNDSASGAGVSVKGQSSIDRAVEYGAGLAYNMGKHWRADVGYYVMDAGKAKLKRSFTDGQGETLNNVAVDMRYSTTKLGITYKF